MLQFLNKTPRQTFNMSKTDIKHDLYKFFTETHYSVLFWNALVYVLFLVTWILSPPIAAVTSIITSILLLAIMIDYNEKTLKNTHWYPITIIFWITVIMVLVIYITNLLYVNIIEKFNTWLDNLKNAKK